MSRSVITGLGSNIDPDAWRDQRPDREREGHDTPPPRTRSNLRQVLAILEKSERERLLRDPVAIRNFFSMGWIRASVVGGNVYHQSEENYRKALRRAFVATSAFLAEAYKVRLK